MTNYIQMAKHAQAKYHADVKAATEKLSQAQHNYVQALAQAAAEYDAALDAAEAA